MSDPWWFQAFGCVLGFDWHSSGVTTVTCGALKEASKRLGKDLGILVAGGKGATSRKTPQEIADAADRYAIASGERLVYASRMSAKVDSAAVQDGFGIYHHSFFFTPEGQWCVVQQGMDEKSGWARRYHWLAESVEDFVCEPHAAVEDLADRPADATAGQGPGTERQLMLLNMVAEEADANRRASAALVRETSDWLLGEIERLTEGPTLFAPARHPVLSLDVNEKRLKSILVSAHEQHPAGFRDPAGPGRRGAGHHPQPVAAGGDHLPGPAFAPRPYQTPRRGVGGRCGEAGPGSGSSPLGRLLARPRRQGWHAVPGGPCDLRSQHRGPDRRGAEGPPWGERQVRCPPPALADDVAICRERTPCRSGVWHWLCQCLAEGTTGRASATRPLGDARNGTESVPYRNALPNFAPMFHTRVLLPWAVLFLALSPAALAEKVVLRAANGQFPPRER